MSLTKTTAKRMRRIRKPAPRQNLSPPSLLRPMSSLSQLLRPTNSLRPSRRPPLKNLLLVAMSFPGKRLSDGLQVVLLVHKSNRISRYCQSNPSGSLCENCLLPSLFIFESVQKKKKSQKNVKTQQKHRKKRELSRWKLLGSQGSKMEIHVRWAQTGRNVVR